MLFRRVIKLFGRVINLSRSDELLSCADDSITRSDEINNFYQITR